MTFDKCTAFRTPNVATNCNCWDDETVIANGHYIQSEMEERGLDVCFVEKAQSWPRPDQYDELRKHVRLVTTLREPWARFWSNFVRDFGTCHHESKPPKVINSIQEYSLKGCWLSDRFGVMRPNFYVRALTGKANPDDHVNRTDLEDAKNVLSLFNQVLVLEEPKFTTKLWTSAGCPGNEEFIQESNSPHTLPALVDAQQHNNTFKSIWLHNNALDVELYTWAKESFSSFASFAQASQGQSNQGQSSQGQSNQGQSNQGQSNQGQTNQGQSNQGQSNQGQSNQGQSNQGQSNQGWKGNQGQANQGWHHQGQSSQGQSNQGQSNQGGQANQGWQRNQGQANQGQGNQWQGNQGQANRGQGNQASQGQGNQGQGNQGQAGQGQANQGQANQGQGSSQGQANDPANAIADALADASAILTP
jgi:hypothetical protein